ncbi:uncharacterized protein LOC133531050 [Cydia pomonella]|uniref:uncharacterized protein LOC133531050 n=1 Tax=Cydia pomonella TaxID=82600 RepID=UPI002ADD3A08|nr:uncharacterized protein LOC133531050 [Cydia pomonella]
MAKMSVGFLSVFNHEEQEWLLYKGRLEQWFIANDISEDTDKSGAKRRAILLSSLAEPTYRLVKNLALPAEVGSLELAKLTGLLDGHFKTGKCGFAERFKFYAAVQSSSESLADWAARVRGLSLHCNFVAASLEESLRDRFVLGMAGGPERDRLFREPLEELTLAKALQLAESIRCAREGAQQTTVRDAADVHKVSARAAGPPQHATTTATRQNGVPQASTSRDQKGSVQCSVCGYFNHEGKKCRFRNASCKLCGVKGHLMRVCTAKNVPSNHHFLQCCTDEADKVFADATVPWQ